MSSFATQVQFTNGIFIGRVNVFPADKDTERFCTLTIGPKHMDQPSQVGPRLTLFFSRVEDIEALTHALADLANQFAASQPVADDTVPIGEVEDVATTPITTDMGGES